MPEEARRARLLKKPHSSEASQGVRKDRRSVSEKNDLVLDKEARLQAVIQAVKKVVFFLEERSTETGEVDRQRLEWMIRTCDSGESLFKAAFDMLMKQAHIPASHIDEDRAEDDDEMYDEDGAEFVQNQCWQGEACLAVLLSSLEPVFQKDKELAKQAKYALLEHGEISLIKETLPQQIFSPEERSYAFAGFLERSETRTSVGLMQGLMRLEEDLGGSPDWRDPRLKEALGGIYTGFIERIAYGNVLLEDLLGFIEWTGVDPIQDPYFSFLKEDLLQDTVDDVARQGNLRLVEGLSAWCGCAVSPEYLPILRREAFKDVLFSDMRLSNASLAEAEEVFQEEYAYFSAHGGKELSQEARQEQITEYLQTLMAQTLHQDTPEALLLFESRVHRIFDQLSFSFSELTQESKIALRSFLTYQRYVKIYQYDERCVVLDRLEAFFSNASLPEEDPIKIRASILYALRSFDLEFRGQKDYRSLNIAPYMRAIQKHLPPPDQLEEFKRVVAIGLEGLASQRGNLLFVEQVALFKEMGLIADAEKSYKEFWIERQINDRGLLFDPFEAAIALNVLPSETHNGVLYLHAIQQGFEEKGVESFTLENPPRNPESLSIEVAQAARTNGIPAAMDIFRQSACAPAETLRLFKTFLRIHSFGLNKDQPITGERKQELQIIFETIESLPFSPQEKTDLAQEMYALLLIRQRAFLDAGLIPWAPPLDIQHSAIRRARVLRTREELAHIPHKNGGTAVSWESIEVILFARPTALPPAEWTPEEFESFSPLLPEKLRNAFRARSYSPEKWEAFLLEELSALFENPNSTDNESSTEYVLAYADQIRTFCKKSPSFRKTYEMRVAGRVALGYWPLDVAEKRPGREGETWSPEARRQIIRVGTKEGAWEAIEALMTESPEQRTAFLKEIKEVVWLTWPGHVDRIRKDLSTTSAAWCKHVLMHFPETVSNLQDSRYFDRQEHNAWVALVYQHRLIPDILKLVPFFDKNDISLQLALATAAINVTKKGAPSIPPEEMALINWNSSSLKQLVRPAVFSLFPALNANPLYNNVEEAIERYERVAAMTGYYAADPYYWGFEIAGSAGGLLRDLDRRAGLAVKFGEGPEDKETARTMAQKSIERICMSRNHGEVKDYIDLRTKYGVQPREVIIREALMRGVDTGADAVSFVLDLLRALDMRIELSLENIQKLPRLSPRSEAIIYSFLLPKQGLERVAAEKAYKERYPFAELIPQLLAIQSPTKREEFCPYEQALKPLLSSLDLPLKDEIEKKGLILFVKQFGLQNLPRLASATIALTGFIDHPESGSLAPALNELRGLLGITSDRLTIDDYFKKIHELLRSMRQDLLEDRPLDARIEQSQLGMELFNSMIPDAGQYRAVDDRASLLKTVGKNTSILRVDACYKPSSKLVHVAEQESVSLEKGESSPAEQAIRLRQQIIEKKYNEESMQRFLFGWQESARLLDEEPSESSRTYWFSIILDRWQTNLATQQKSLETIQNPHGRAARQKEIERLEQAIAKITALIERDQPDALEEPSTEELLEELQSIFVTKEGKIDRVELEKQAGDVARGLLIARMAEHSHAHYMAMQEARRRQAGQKLISKESVDAWERWFREEYLEHFSGMNPKVDVGLSPSTLLLANKLWRIDGLTAKIEQTKTDPGSGPIGHPVIDAFLVIQRARQEMARLQRNERAGEQKPLEFWPVKGIGRVLAGDIANACYHSHRQVLAEGGHQKITALLMTIPGETEIAGSTLLIDTKALSGKRVLVIRALNPTEAIIRKSLDAQAIVEATIDYAKEVAQATEGDEEPIREIRICHDHTGGHSTNRLEVFNAEAALVATNRWTTGEELIDVPETNFNGYDVHSARQTRVVWQAPEK